MFRAVFLKEARLELRNFSTSLSLLLFALLILFLMNYLIPFTQGGSPVDLGVGCVWMAVALAGVLALQRIFGQERDRGTLDALILAPVDRSAVFCGKAAWMSLLTAVVGILVSLAAGFLLNIPLLSPLVLLGLLLGCMGYSAGGVFVAALSIHSRGRDFLLPVLFFPLAFPLLLAAVRFHQLALTGSLQADSWLWLGLLLGYLLIMLAVVILFFDSIFEG